MKEQKNKIIILILFMIILTVLNPKTFLTISNLGNVLWSISVVGIIASGSIYAILVGGIDLSVGAILAITGVIMTKTINYYNYTNIGVLIAILFVLVVSLIIGTIHGLIITLFDVPAFLVTFASQIVIFGLAMLITNNKIIQSTNSNLFKYIGLGKLFSIPVPVYIMFIMFIINYILLNRKKIGRYLYAVGGNKEASLFSGISVNKIIIFAYIISSLAAAIGGIVLSSMNQQAMSQTGRGYETDVITAAVIGGISLAGGEGKVEGVLFGAILVGLLNNGLNLLNVPSTYAGLVKGLVIIIAVSIDMLSKGNESIILKIFSRKGKE